MAVTHERHHQPRRQPSHRQRRRRRILISHTKVAAGPRTLGTCLLLATHIEPSATHCPATYVPLQHLSNLAVWRLLAYRAVQALLQALRLRAKPCCNWTTGAAHCIIVVALITGGSTSPSTGSRGADSQPRSGCGPAEGAARWHSKCVRGLHLPPPISAGCRHRRQLPCSCAWCSCAAGGLRGWAVVQHMTKGCDNALVADRAVEHVWGIGRRSGIYWRTCVATATSDRLWELLVVCNAPCT